jgi:transcriptional regulator with XRE-family HTH domain
MTFGTRLKKLRTQHKMTQSEFAKRFNITQSTVARLEKGDRDISDDVKIEIAKYFGVTLDYLLGVEDKTSFDEVKDDLTVKLEDDVVMHFYDASKVTPEKIEKYKALWKLLNDDKK